MSAETKPAVVRPTTLPAGVLPRGLSRPQAAEYYGVSVGTFDRLVAEGRAPGPIHVFGRRIWDRLQLDEAFACLAGSEANPWDGGANDNGSA